MQEIPIVLGFTAGELSPWLSTRFDLQAYQRGAALISNFRIQPYGGLEVRRGTQFMCKRPAGPIRLFPFCYAENDALLLEFFSGGMRVYREGTPVQTDTGSDYTLTTPWLTEEQLASLHFTQVNDAIYVCSPSYPPVVIYRYANNKWRYEQPVFETYPRETHAAQNGRLTVLFERGGLYANLSLEGSSQEFSADMADSEILLADATIPGRTLFANEIQKTGTVATPDLSTSSIARHALLHQRDDTTGMYHFYRCIRAYSPSAFNGSTKLSDYPHYFQPGIMRLDSSMVPYEVASDWELTTSGTWNGHWELWRSYDTPDDEPDFHLWNWTCIKSFSQSDYENRQNWAISGSESRPCRLVLVCRCSTDPEVLGAMVQFRVLGGQREYKFVISSVIDAQHARARVLRTYLGTPVSFSTNLWSFGAFGVRNGYPAFSAFFQGRLWLGGMPGLPTTLLASVIDDFHNFRTGSDDDAALHLSIVDSDQSRICWLCATRQLLVGTSDSEWVLVSANDSILTPTSVAFRRQSSVGSEGMSARAVENTVLFVQRGGKRMREIAYRLESDGFSATDISMLAEHLFASGVKDWCVQRGSNVNVWVLMNDGSVAVLTINMEQQVTAWQRVVFEGREVLQMAALQSSAGQDDEMWFAFRIISNNNVSLERMRDTSLHLDSYEEVDALRNMELKCSYHLAGTIIMILDAETGEGGRSYATAGGLRGIPFVIKGRRYKVGIPIEANLQTMPLEGANSFNSVRQFSRFKLRLLSSDLNFEFRSTASDAWEHFLPEHAPCASVPYTGALRLAQMPDADVGQSLCLRYSAGGDFRLLAITQEVDHHGK
ncbi:MAG: hypothetical protein IKA23_05995 [Akkermansia sp.]|nr:hypothetical protein [Akkermansia sp.]